MRSFTSHLYLPSDFNCFCILFQNKLVVIRVDIAKPAISIKRMYSNVLLKSIKKYLSSYKNVRLQTLLFIFIM